MLSRIRLAGFKSIGDEPVDVELAPLTIFVGGNGAGKSSILQAIAVLAQGNAAQPDGHLTKLGTWSDVRHLPAGNVPLFMELSLTQDRPIATCGLSLYESHVAPTIENEQFVNILLGEKIAAQIRQFAEPPSVVAKVLAQGFWRFSAKKLGTSLPHALPQLGPLIAERDPMNVTAGDVQHHSFENRMWLDHDTVANVADMLTLDHEILRAGLHGQVYFLSTPRLHPSSTLASGRETPWVGRDGELTVGVLARVCADRKQRSVIDEISSWTKKFGLEDPYAFLRQREWIEARFYDAYIQAAKKPDLPLSSASYGSLQILPVIIQLFVSPQGSTIMIEEPEESLHPRAQMELASLFARAVTGLNQQVILSTHSEILPLAVAKAIGEGALPSDAVAVYHVERSEKTGTTVCRRLDVDANGYVKGRIPSFGQVEDELFEHWANTVHPDKNE